MVTIDDCLACVECLLEMENQRIGDNLEFTFEFHDWYDKYGEDSTKFEKDFVTDYKPLEYIKMEIAEVMKEDFDTGYRKPDKEGALYDIYMDEDYGGIITKYFELQLKDLIQKEKHKLNRMNNYGVFLMAELLRVHGVLAQDLEYDLVWEKAVAEFESYDDSDFNVDTAGEYECIEEYIKDKFPREREEFLQVIMFPEHNRKLNTLAKLTFLNEIREIFITGKGLPSSYHDPLFQNLESFIATTKLKQSREDYNERLKERI